MKAGFKKTVRRRREYIGFFRRGPFLAAFFITTSVALYVFLPRLFRQTYVPALPAGGALAVAETAPPVLHLKTPEPLRAIYMTSCVAGSRPFRDTLARLIEETELNSVVIDVKDWSGYLSFVPEAPALLPFVSPRCAVRDLQEFIRTLHEKGIYVIGRITVFQDPVLSKRRPELAVARRTDGGIWKDYKGLTYTDPGSEEVWKYTVSVAKESYALGFDELNFDYVRFPSDGPMDDIAYPWSGVREKSAVLESFFAYLSRELKAVHPAAAPAQSPILSVDLFGMTTTNTDDLNIGQVLEKAAPYFDYIAPMVYPSHYPPFFNGWDNPNHYPYEVVRYSVDSAVKRLLATTTPVALSGVLPLSTTTMPYLYPKPVFPKAKLRPWLQDFDYGGNYDVKEVKAEMQAVYDAGLTSWMLWSPSNQYTKGALLPEANSAARP